MTLNKYHIEDSLVKFYGYYSIITSDKDLTYLKRGDAISSEAVFNFNLYLDLYIFLLEYSLDWFDDDDEYREDDAPISLDELELVIDRGNELIKTLVDNPLNY